MVQANGDRIEEMINSGLSVVGYFGHSSANNLGFNLNEPENYTNVGKYPFFNVSGCSAGNNYIFDAGRLNGNTTYRSILFLQCNVAASASRLVPTSVFPRS